MKIIFDLDLNRCVSCGACIMACMDQNDIDPREQRLYRHVHTLEQTKDDGTLFVEEISISCMHCEDAPCIKGCPAGCLQKDGEMGLTIYDNSNCIGCHSCSMACPFAAPCFGSDGKMEKCDGCYVRLQNGLKPACVKVCPFEALKAFTEEEYSDVKMEKSLHAISEMILKGS